jgi:hypothetical protein
MRAAGKRLDDKNCCCCDLEKSQRMGMVADDGNGGNAGVCRGAQGWKRCAGVRRTGVAIAIDKPGTAADQSAQSGAQRSRPIDSCAGNRAAQ